VKKPKKWQERIEAEGAVAAATEKFNQIDVAHKEAINALKEARAVLSDIAQKEHAERAAHELATMDTCVMTRGRWTQTKTKVVIVKQSPKGWLTVRTPGDEDCGVFTYAHHSWWMRGGNGSLTEVPQKYTDAAIAAKRNK